MTQRAIIEQLLGITILTEKAENLKEQIKTTKEKVTEETAKIKAQQQANERVESTITSLQGTQRAWISKKTQDVEKLQTALNELEHLDIDNELDAHEKLSGVNKIMQLQLLIKKKVH